ncbi:MAG: hypothetical protein K2H74_00100, partial [Paramuribaculum sp.]|nr:hypothetical protein [Paramuribaculum sp.]
EAAHTRRIFILSMAKCYKRISPYIHAQNSLLMIEYMCPFDSPINVSARHFNIQYYFHCVSRERSLQIA